MALLVARPFSKLQKALATCGATAALGDLVYVSGNFALGQYQVEKADVTNYNKMPVVAVVIAKITPTSAVIQFEGEVVDQYTGLVPGKVYFVGTDSRPTTTPPSPSLGGRAYIQPIGVALSSDKLKLTPSLNLSTRIG